MVSRLHLGVVVSHEWEMTHCGNIPIELPAISRDSKVWEHPDTKSIVGLMSSAIIHRTAILLKWRPFGRSNNRRVTSGIILASSNWRELAGIGMVEGGFQPSPQ